ncbi:arginyltransferase [Aestuariibacter salexigens]|uniref:arginyltransferase n=1 Tax=Aestuariibacter salexigens TaxID=226010 RepID=UPI00041E841A|nr:arginyltransferase [Aestuariibacter salexigens]
MKFGLTQGFSCSYLPAQTEQLLVYADEGTLDPVQYEALISCGFRRSGDQVYRPHCPACRACQSIRVPVTEFTPSRSQKRILRRNHDLSCKISRHEREAHYQLYERYINTRHKTGSMYPASVQQFHSFIRCAWIAPLFIEAYLNDELVAVAVTDELPNALSALYTFFAPDMEERSLGTFMILQQIEKSLQLDKAFLYLGYQVDDCSKMNYKRNFYPHQRFYADKWHHCSKNTS